MVYETILDVTLQELKNRVSRINFQQFPFYFFVFSYTRGFFVEWCFFFWGDEGDDEHKPKSVQFILDL